MPTRTVNADLDIFDLHALIREREGQLLDIVPVSGRVFDEGRLDVAEKAAQILTETIASFEAIGLDCGGTSF